jgi:hypothetical protein
MATWCGPISLELPKRPLGVQGLSLYETLTKSLLVSVSFLRFSRRLLHCLAGELEAAEMKSISAAIIVLSGIVALIASGHQINNRESIFNMGLIVVIAGLVGWAVALRTEK